MKTGLKLFVGILFIFLCVGMIGAQNKGLEKAQGLWEKVIEAKGGREKLYSVQNLIVSSKSQSQKDSKEFSNSHLVDLFVLPSQWWSWIDQRPGFTLAIRQYDFKRELGYEIEENASLDVLFKPLKSLDTSQGRSEQAKVAEHYSFEKKKFYENQLIYLMETKWFKPKIEGFRTERIGFKEINIIEVSCGLEKIEYYIDTRTNLPNQIKMRTWIESTKDYYEDAFYLEDYIEIEGVKFPQVIRRGRKTRTKTTYQVNVKYNESLFENQPRIDMGPDAWKPRS